jgi:magnesium transporter
MESLPAEEPSPLDVLGTTRVEPIAPSGPPVELECAVYLDGSRLPDTFTPSAAVDECRRLTEAGRTVFVGLSVDEPAEDQMREVGEAFGLDDETIQDSLHTHRRPSLRRVGDVVSMVFKTVNYVPHESVFSARKIAETGEELVVVGSDVVVAVGHGVHGGLDGLRDELEHRPDLLGVGPFVVLLGVADRVVNSYLEVASLIKADIDAIELAVFSVDSVTDIGAIYLLKRDVVDLNRAIGPLTRALSTITDDHQELVPPEIRPYLDQVVARQAEAAEQIANHDERLSVLLQAAHARVDVQQNVDVRKISAWAAMAVAVTTITGICSMNFTEMRWVVGLDYSWGYPAALVFLASFCGLLYLTFRRKHWL